MVPQNTHTHTHKEIDSYTEREGERWEREEGDRHGHRRHNRERSKVVKEALLALVHILCK